MARWSVALRRQLRPTWYRLKRLGYRAELMAEATRRALPGGPARAERGPLRPPVGAVNAEASGAPFQVVDPPQVLRRDQPPHTIEPGVHPHLQFDLEHTVPAMGVLELEHGRVWGPTGAIVDRDNRLIEDLSIAWNQSAKSKGQHPIFTNWRYQPMRTIEGTVAALTTDGADLYYHWLFQLLPRIDLLERAGWTPDRVDYYLVNRAARPYERDTLAKLGIRPEQIFETAEHPHIRADLLLAPGIPLHGSQFSQPLVNFVRGRLAGLPAADACAPGERLLYLTRAGAGYRHVVNEAEVRAALLQRGFEAIALEELSFDDQVATLREARVVIGPHGGGMSNTVFCAAGTRVGEIFAEEYIAPWFWFLANITGVEHHYMIGAAEPRAELAEAWNSGASMHVDLAKLELFVDRLLA